MKTLTNASAEQLVIGSIIKNPETIDTVATKIGPQDFHEPRIGTIYAAAARLALAGKSGGPALIEELRAELKPGGICGVPVMWIEGRRVPGFDKARGDKPYRQALSAALAGRPVTPRPLPFIVLGVVLSILVTLGTRTAARRQKESS